MNTIQNILNLCGKTIRVDNDIYGFEKNFGYTIDHIDIRSSNHATLVLTGYHVNKPPFNLVVNADELKALADIGKFVRGNDEYYIQTQKQVH